VPSIDVADALLDERRGLTARLGQGQPCNASAMDERDAAQAAELVRTLRDQLHGMTDRLVRLERQDVPSWTSRALAIRCEAAALRRDVNEAQILIGRLQFRYLNDDGHAQACRPVRRRQLSLSLNRSCPR
jgi:hypothetical protein